MLYPKNIEQKLGFSQIRDLVAEHCLSSLGKVFTDKIQFLQEYELISKLVSQTDEFTKIIGDGLAFPVQNYINVHPYLDKIKPEGAFLNPEEFGDIKASLQTIVSCTTFLENHQERFPELFILKKDVLIDPELLKQIDRIIDDHGLVRSSASQELSEIRKQLQLSQLKVRRELDKVLHDAKKEGFIEEEFSVTIRNGRMVVPIRAEFKRNIKGFIQDESSTGQTVFIEPTQVLEINNTIRELEYAERREIIKILTKLSQEFRIQIPALKKAYVFLGLMDFIRAKAKVCILLKANKPEISKYPELSWTEARHPLLFLSLQKINKPIVPLCVKISSEQRIVLISGPNAGGKSVALKTVGLIQYMFQCGFLIPVQEGSRIGIFKDLFMDIGDEQSLENDLSTYSSHLRNMKYFLQFSDQNTLFLIDEFGTGTEPNYGGAIAEAVLEELNSKNARGVITTHYTNLKTFANHTNGVVNAAMLFDMHLLEPLYKLEIGQPGSSFAMEIARKIGLSAQVVESAASKVGADKVEYDRLIKELEKEKSKSRRRTDELKDQQRILKKRLEKLEEQNEFLETHKKKLMNEAKNEAKRLVQDAKQKIEETIRAIREQKADKSFTKEVRKELEQFSETLIPESIKEKEILIELEDGEIGIGDAVRVIGQDTLGEVIEIRGKEAEIMIGLLKSKIKLNRLQKVSKRTYRKQIGETSPSRTARSINLNEKYAEFSPNVDVRGMRVEEVIPLADSLIDNAVLFSVSEVRIVHGKGNGILRTVLRDYLKNHAYIKHMADEHPDRGGAGVTIITL
jgi:DNA mismatch repair protein MutS2